MIRCFLSSLRLSDMGRGGGRMNQFIYILSLVDFACTVRFNLGRIFNMHKYTIITYNNITKRNFFLMNYDRIGRVPDPTWIIKNWWGRQGGGVYRPLSLFSLSESSSSWYLDKSPSSSSSSWLGKEQTLIKNQNSVTRFNAINSDFLFAFIYIIFSETAPFLGKYTLIFNWILCKMWRIAFITEWL